MRVAISSGDPRTFGILWCPYLCTPGHHRIAVDVYSPMERGAARAGLGRVRGWVPDHCGPDNEDKYYVPCDTDYESIYCPVVTGCNPEGGFLVQLWTAGWSAYNIQSAAIMGGRAGRKCPDLDVDNVWTDYLHSGATDGMQHARLEGSINVPEDQ